MAYICKTPGCGNDLTATVLRLIHSSGPQFRSKDLARRQPDPVIVRCAKCGASHEYP
jgi:hypothetical protein